VQEVKTAQTLQLSPRNVRTDAEVHGLDAPQTAKSQVELSAEVVTIVEWRMP
jgi:hypothetical protein